MLRMYECNWCKTRQMKDDDSVEDIADSPENVFGTCYKRCLYKRKTLGMSKMIRNEDGDWIKEKNEKI